MSTQDDITPDPVPPINPTYTIAVRWKMFADMILPGQKDVDIQYREMKKAFYGGALDMLMFTQIMSVQLEEETICDVLEANEEELKKFFEDGMSRIIKNN